MLLHGAWRLWLRLLVWPPLILECKLSAMQSPLDHHAELLSLAPVDLQNRRARRYHGDDLAVHMESFSPDDQALLRELYAFLQRLFNALRPESATRVSDFHRFLGTEEIEHLFDKVRAFGYASYQAVPTTLMAKTIHDVRGGGLTSLYGYLQLCRLGTPESSTADTVYFLTRDHLKIMRNALLGLDDEKRAEDLQIKIHGTDFIVEKWNGALLHGGGREVRLEVECPQHVAISECCVEFGALDRILYNLLNNACRHSAADRIRLVLFPVPDAEGENLRFVLQNAIEEADLAQLRNTDLQSLFRAGVSTTGSGYGLSVAADFVANAFGLAAPEAAVAGQYIGATLLHDHFVIWFHWPIVAEY